MTIQHLSVEKTHLRFTVLFGLHNDAAWQVIGAAVLSSPS